MLPVRHVLHDEVSVRAAAPVERRLPASDAAGQGGEDPAGQDAVSATSCSTTPIWSASSRQFRWWRSGQHGEPDGRRRAASWRSRSASTGTRGFRSSRRSVSTSLAPESTAFPVRDGERTPGKVAVFSTCYVNYNEPGIGLDLLQILEHNEIPYVLIEEKCCGMPQMENGELEEIEKRKNHNIPRMAKYAREGYAIMTPIPSCTLMFKQELPLMFRDDADVQRGARGDVRSVRVPRRAPQGRTAQDRLQAAARARRRTRSPVICACRTSGRRPKSC